MNKFVKIFLILTMLLVFFGINVFAYNSSGVEVTLRVEGLISTIMQGTVRAETFSKAVQKLGDECNVEVIMKNNSIGQELYSVAGIKNNTYTSNDRWKYYLIRNGNIINIEDITNTNLVNGDKLVVYYGDIENTKVVTDINESYSDGKITIQLSSSVTTWFEENGVWKPKTISNNLNNVNIHMTIGNKKEIVKTTDLEGKAVFDIETPNIYSYYAEGYKENTVPTIVKTQVNKNTLELENTKNLTRAEATAFFINYFGIISGETNRSFIDVDKNTLYKQQIDIAASAGIVIGDNEGEFKPENQITLQEVVIILYNIYKDKPNINTINLDTIGNPSEWAKPYIKGAIEKGIIKNFNFNWTVPMTLNDIISIL